MTNLKRNYTTIDEEETALNNFIADRGANFKEFLSFPSYQGKEENLNIAAKWLNIENIRNSNTVDIIECTSANHSLSNLLQVLKLHFESIIVEPFTYQAFKTIAENYGFKLYSSEFDTDGLTLNGLKSIVEKTNSKLIYLQPTIHNPTCVVMPLKRRKEIADFAQENGLYIIEDDAYRFLHPDAPLRFLDLLPEYTFHIYSLSKPFNPLIKTSYLITPVKFKEELVDSVRLNSSGHSSLLSAIAVYLMETKVLDAIILKKQNLAKQVQDRIYPIIGHLSFQSSATSHHIWVKLPDGVESDDLTKELMQEKIFVLNGKDFAVENLSAKENYIRVSLGAEKEIGKIEQALKKIVSIIDNKQIKAH